ncbi:2-hydroxyacid dehydrogenase [Kozakia baliensis]|uniref:Glyoxylate/hydroxypyruvate reductase A n=2 Tax=Kozakia baliensis TaxID=153496 RepID=A0A1D8UYW7_9PROT|nr:glyoxylate/hydroxypyruvate reductase A [Kozakia baliensis]AOX18824.1 glyoxylate/hydroxypyruvate reductase A [Kozakia baliensis]GBR26876.1 D-isomer specific 2-hydroxyacid dehydrogenase [Kozakia baliensis NRIC 0488]GEL65628.1 glyoxylate/hydroxypyruvate reductase A [Kozakia baliensis]
MRLAVKSGGKSAFSEWSMIFRNLMPDLNVVDWDEANHHPQSIDFVLAWQPEGDILSRMLHLKGIISTGAGVDHIIQDPLCPRNVPIYRMGSEEISAQMADYVLWAVLCCVRRTWRWHGAQATRTWLPPAPNRLAKDVTVGVMGLGHLGRSVADHLCNAGFSVRGWARSVYDLPGIHTYAGPETFPAFLKKVDVLICLLPSTPDTVGILNARTFAALSEGASVINVGRGSHLVEGDLLAALNEGLIAGAILDVFDYEPLPRISPFWSHPQIIITPHAAAEATRPSKAAHTVEIIKAIMRGEEGPLRYHPDKGY